jgi:hypothetical protein
VPKVAHELDQTKQVIPAHPVRGSVKGSEFVPTAAQIQRGELTLQIVKPGTTTVERSLKLNLAPMLVSGQPVPPILGREWKIKLDTEPGTAVPEVWIELPGKNAFFFQSGYAMTLELGPRVDGKVAGKIYLSIPDEEQTTLAGVFEVPYPRQPHEPPSPEDAPYITGSVTVTGAKPDTQVRVAYAAFGQTVSFPELQIPFDPSPAELAQWVSTEPNKDQTSKSTLVAGNGMNWPFRYEHVKLPPGRYLVSAGVSGGPTVWKWVNLPAGGMLTENFTLDATKSGSVEVSVPANVTGKVFVAPADEPDKPALDAATFHAFALQVMRQDVAIAGGKALVKNLAPGKYEVRVGELKGTVEIVADKTAELMLTAPKQP